MMASYKHVSGPDGESGQYHPVLYAKYWKMAVNAIELVPAKMKDHVFKVKFEELIESPNQTAAKLASFLGSSFTETIESREGNSSFKQSARKQITPTEQWICEKIAGRAMQQEGYPPSSSRFRLVDTWDLLWTTGRFTLHQCKRILKDSRSRVSIMAYITRVFRKPRRSA